VTRVGDGLPSIPPLPLPRGVAGGRGEPPTRSTRGDTLCKVVHLHRIDRVHFLVFNPPDPVYVVGRTSANRTI
jgi:hypothetical protein